MAADLPIPVFTDLESCYANLGTATSHAERWSALADEFKARYGHAPAYIARAPGRVNLIGEHIDYALFGVFPAAVEPDILIACGPHSSSEPDKGHVRAQNVDGRYKEKLFAPVKKRSGSVTVLDDDVAEQEEEVHVEEWHMDINKKELNWESYVKAGYYGVLNRFFHPSVSDEHPVRVDLLVTGSVPAGSGLSSSAAMVVASTLIFLAINNKLEGLSKGELVEMAVENEKRVGVNSGGMDQAASVISTPASALYISFFPRLHAELVELPGTQKNISATEAPLQGASFVILNSLVVNNKAVAAKTQYNLRVVETLVGARVLANLIGVPLDADSSLWASGTKRERITFREVLGRWLGAQEKKGQRENTLSPEALKEGLERLLATEVVKLKPVGAVETAELGLTMDEMVTASGLEKDEFEQVYLSWVEVEAERFQLYKRAKHVLSEALRVLQFREVCLRGHSDEGTLSELGRLMDESMTSCAQLFECSHPRLDALTTLARSSGAYGARLTGAGWGGCAVALVAEDKVHDFIEKVRAEYEEYHKLNEEQFKEAVFATKPSSGAFVYKVTE